MIGNKLSSNIVKNWDRLLQGLEEKKREEIGLSLHLIKENCERLAFREDEYRFALDRMKKFVQGVDNTHELQLRLVDKIEALHQQIYVTLASLIKVVSYLGINGKKESIPIDSVRKFLLHLKERTFRYQSPVHVCIDELLKSEDYRAKFVDHPQQHKMHNWMTYIFVRNGIDKCAIIYYPKYGSIPVYAPGPITDPYDPRYKPPLGGVKAYFISPDVDQTINAIFLLINETLSLN